MTWARGCAMAAWEYAAKDKHYKLAALYGLVAATMIYSAVAGIAFGGDAHFR